MTKTTLVVALGISPCVVFSQEIADSIKHLPTVEVLAHSTKGASTTSMMSIPLEKLPLTISSISMQDLALRGLYQPLEAMNFTTGAGIRRTFGAFMRLNVRGFDDAPIVIDGMRDERTAGGSYPLSDLSDVAQIEILKGSASVLHGHSAIGGVLNIVRKRASRTPSLEARIQGDRFGSYRLIASGGGALSPSWSILSGLSYAGGKGWRETNNQRHKVYTTLQGKWRYDELNIFASYSRDFYGTEIGLPPILLVPVYRTDGDKLALQAGEVQSKVRRDARYNNESDAMHHKRLELLGDWVHRFGQGFKLREQLNISVDDIDYFGTEQLNYPTSEKPDYPYYYTQGKKKVYVDLEHVLINAPSRIAHKAWAVQNQISVDGKYRLWEGTHHFTIGHAFAYFNRVSFTGKGAKNAFGPGVGSKISSYEPKSAGPMTSAFNVAMPRNLITNALFAHNLMEFSPQLQLMLSARFDHYRFRHAGSIPAKDGKKDYDEPSIYGYTRTQSLSYRAGLVYSPLKELSVYASVGSFFRPDGTTAKASTIYIGKDGQPIKAEDNLSSIFEPQRGYQLELGTRLKPTTWLEFEASAYYIKQNNYVVNLGTKTLKVDGKDVRHNVIGQIGQSQSCGVELELQARPCRDFDFSLGYSYTHASVGDIADNEYQPDNQLSGKLMPYIPQHQLYSLGAYKISRGLLRGLGLHYNIYYMSKRYHSLANTVSFDGYYQLDLGATYRLSSKFTLGANVQNVLNAKTYQEGLSNQLVPNEPINLQLSLSYKL